MFTNFLQQTDGKEEVDIIRKNILVRATKDDKPKGNHQLPLQLQNFMRSMKLKEDLIKFTKLSSQVKQEEKNQLDKIYKNSKLKIIF